MFAHDTIFLGWFSETSSSVHVGTSSQYSVTRESLKRDVVLVDGINKGIKHSSLSLKLFPEMVLLNSSNVIVVKLLVKYKYLRLCDLTHSFHRKSKTTIGKLSLINIFYYRYQFLDTKVETRKSTIKVKVLVVWAVAISSPEIQNAVNSKTFT